MGSGVTANVVSGAAVGAGFGVAVGFGVLVTLGVLAVLLVGFAVGFAVGSSVGTGVGDGVGLGVGVGVGGGAVGTGVGVSGIVGVGSTKRLSAVRWGVAGRIVWAWVLTIPAAATMSAITYYIFSFFH